MHLPIRAGEPHLRLTDHGRAVDAVDTAGVVQVGHVRGKAHGRNSGAIPMVIRVIRDR